MRFTKLFDYPRLLILIGLLTALFHTSAIDVRAQEATPTPVQKSEEEKKLEEENRMLTLKRNNLLLQKEIEAAQKAEPQKSDEEKRLEEEKKRLGLEKDISVAQKDIAEAQKGELAAKYPLSSASPLAGTTTVNDGAVIESQMMAYTAMGKAANRIVDGIKTREGLQISNLAIFNERDVNLLLSYKITNNQTNIIRQGYCNFIDTKDTERFCPENQKNVPEFGSALLQIGKSFLGAFVDLTSMFRTNIEVKGTTFEIDEAPLVAEVFRAGRREVGFGKDVSLYYPAMFPPDINPDGESSILAQLEVLNKLRTEALRIVGGIEEKNKNIEEIKGKIKNLQGSIEQGQLQKAAVQAKKKALLVAYCVKSRGYSLRRCEEMSIEQLERFSDRMSVEHIEKLLELNTEIIKIDSNIAKQNNESTKAQEDKAKLEAERDSLWEKVKGKKDDLTKEDILAQLKARNAQFDKFVESLIAVNSATGVNPLTAYIRAENLRNAMPEGSHWLQLKVLKAGGNNRTKTNLIWDIFTGGNRLSHSGGVVIVYNLYDETGKSVASDTVTEYLDYRKSNKVKSLPHPAVDDSVIVCSEKDKKENKCF